MAGAGDTETVVRIRPPAKDAFGDPSAGEADELPIDGCLFAPGKSAEPQFAANQVDTDATLYTPPGVDVLPTDHIRVREQVYRVVGDPADWGPRWGVVIGLRKVTG